MGNPVPVAPSLEPVLEAVLAPREDDAPNRRTLRISALAIVAAFLAAVAAQLLTRLIGLITNVNPRRVIGIVSRSDLLEAHERRLHARHRVERTINLAATLAWVRPNER